MKFVAAFTLLVAEALPAAAGALCGENVCLSYETCVVDEYQPYCRSTNGCEDWFCPGEQECQIDPFGIVTCVSLEETMCGNYQCTAGETCSQDTSGDLYCAFPASGTLCGDKACLPFEKCVADEFHPYCRTADVCDNILCSDNKVCIIDVIGYPICVDTETRIFKGTFKNGDCDRFSNRIQSLLTNFIKDITKDEVASVTYACGPINFLVKAAVPKEFTVKRIRSKMGSTMMIPELSEVLGELTTISDSSAAPKKYCHKDNGVGILIDEVCFLTACDYGFHVHKGFPDFVCVTDTNRSYISDNVILISIIGVLVAVVVSIIGMASFCYRRQQAEYTVPTIAAVPGVVTQTKDFFPERFEFTI
eukprot:TRINITY_DN24572_c0_g1_i1.p1 TRINITY_DN24572_c0_g1~~TRINITY_DN24572_c0_g1_i1.p1  ORF type:complete len:362 (+),score=72.05 TRINITY_DN24572_c0_g1_i1:35-1120(+)